MIIPDQPSDVSILSDNGNLTDIGITVHQKRYSLREKVNRDIHGNITNTPSKHFGMFKDQEGHEWFAMECWRDTCWRVACAVASVEKEDIREKWTREFFFALYNQEFIANSPTMWGAGVDGGMLSACFLEGLEGIYPEDPDSLEAITRLQRNVQYIVQSGGGIGVHLGALRPVGSPVRGGAHGTALGPVKVLEGLWTLCHKLTQSGKRESAGMCMLPVSHPDIVNFIRCKTQEGHIHNFNISVAVTNEFMEAVKSDGDFVLSHPKWVARLDHFPEDFRQHVVSIDGNSATVKAKAIFDLIVQGAHKNGEPGLWFSDEANREEWKNHGIILRGTNPCGEQVLPDHGVCQLSHISLLKCVNSKTNEFDWDKYKRLTHLGVRFLDDVISINNFPLPEIKEMSEKYRNIGLGILGFADMLLELDIAYGSHESIQMAEKIEKFRRDEATFESERLCMEKGSNYGGNRRNIILLSIAPTGNTSLVCGVEGSGIEPIFNPGYWRKDHVNNEGVFIGSKYLDKKSFRCAVSEWMDKDGKKTHKPEFEVSFEEHIKIQAAFQKWNDCAISKTINMSESATKEDIAKAIFMAYDLRLKGFTIYRNNSRQEQVLSTEKKEGKFNPLRALNREEEPKQYDSFGRPQNLQGTTTKLTTGYGTLYATVNKYNGRPVELFAQIGKAGGYTASFTEAIARLTSIALQHGIPPEMVAKQLEGIRSPRPSFSHMGRILSIPDAIAKVLIPPQQSEHETIPTQDQTEDEIVKRGDSPECVECGATLVLQEGCVKCISCGYSEC